MIHVQDQIGHIGESVFPASVFGMSHAYDLPTSENLFVSRCIDCTERKDEEGMRDLSEQVISRNEKLSMPNDLTGMFHLITGVCSRFPPEDVRFYIKIGGGIYRSKSEQRAINAAATVLYRAFNNSRPFMGWVPSPTTVQKIAGKYYEAFPMICSATSMRAQKAKGKRKNGDFEYEYSSRKRLEGSQEWPFSFHKEETDAKCIVLLNEDGEPSSISEPISDSKDLAIKIHEKKENLGIDRNQIAVLDAHHASELKIVS